MLQMATVQIWQQQQQQLKQVVLAVVGRAPGHRQGEAIYFVTIVLGYRPSIPLVDTYSSRLMWQRGRRRREQSSKEGGVTL